MIGGLVENQDVGFLSISLQKMTRAASPPESASVFFNVLSLKQHLAEDAAELFGRRRGSNWRSQSITVSLLDGLAVILREVADAGFVSPDDLPGVDGEALLFIFDGAGRVRQQRASMVVLPVPLRPMSAIFSPRLTLAVKSRMTGAPS